MNEKTEQIRAVMADEAFVKSCIEAENEEAVQKLFAGKGIEMSLTEIEMMKELIGAVADGKISEEQLNKLAEGGKLSEEELEEVAGGFDLYKYAQYGDEVTREYYERWIHSNISNGLTKTLNGKAVGALVGGVVGGVAVVGATAYGIYKFKDDIAEGASTAYGWVKDNITRW